MNWSGRTFSEDRSVTVSFKRFCLRRESATSFGQPHSMAGRRIRLLQPGRLQQTAGLKFGGAARIENQGS